MEQPWASPFCTELCFTPTNTSWANLIEAQFGPLRSFVMGGCDHPSHTVLAGSSRTICAGATPTPATADLLWTLNHPDTWYLLVRRCGWTAGRYEQWVGDTLSAQLLGGSPAATAGLPPNS